jgi:hypothetical protein
LTDVVDELDLLDAPERASCIILDGRIVTIDAKLGRDAQPPILVRVAEFGSTLESLGEVVPVFGLTDAEAVAGG